MKSAPPIGGALFLCYNKFSVFSNIPQESARQRPTNCMNFLKQNLVNYFFIFLAAILLAFFIFRGISGARLAKQSETIVQNARATAKGLQYFFSDHERFPQAQEFVNAAVMRDYFSVFPPEKFASQQCPETWAYTRPTPGNYELGFCLPKDSGGFAQGWNKIVGKQETQ